MKDELRKDLGYRELSEEEQSELSRIAQLEMSVFNALDRVDAYLQAQEIRLEHHLPDAKFPEPVEKELNRVKAAKPKRDLALARTHFEDAFMRLKKGVAQPAPPGKLPEDRKRL